MPCSRVSEAREIARQESARRLQRVSERDGGAGTRATAAGPDHAAGLAFGLIFPDGLVKNGRSRRGGGAGVRPLPWTMAHGKGQEPYRAKPIVVSASSGFRSTKVRGFADLSYGDSGGFGASAPRVAVLSERPGIGDWHTNGVGGGVAPPATALLVSERFPPAVGGSAVLFDNIYRRLTDIDTVVLTDARTSPGRDGSDGGCRVIRRRIGGPQWGILHPAGAWSHLRLAADIRRMDVPADAIVHCGRSLPEGVAARLASAAGGPGYVCWAHGEDLASAETSRELTAITRRVCRDALAMFANSANTARVLETAWHVAPERIHIVHPGVDATRFHPGVDGRHIRERFAPNGEMLLLSVGRLQRRKGHDVAIAAVDALRADMPGVRYVIAGDGEERARLEALVLERGLSGHVTFAGEVPDADLPAYYRAASVFLLPNRIEGGDFEGFGIVFLEAAASGIPAIGGRSGGVAEAVQEGVSGFLVGGESADELAAVVRRFATSPYLRQRMGRAARARAVDEFSWDRAAMRVSKIHHDLRASLRLSRRFRLSRRRLSEASEGSSC